MIRLTTPSLAGRVLNRLERHELSWASLRRFTLFFPVCLYLVIVLFHHVPVVYGFEGEQVLRVSDKQGASGTLRLRVSGIKLRACVLIPGSKAGQVRMGDGPWIEVAFDWYKDRTPGSSAPADLDRQSFGLWQWRVDDEAVLNGVRINDITAVRTSVLHRCDGFLKQTTIGPLPVQRINAKALP